jgi:hypothetical protein
MIAMKRPLSVYPTAVAKATAAAEASGKMRFIARLYGDQTSEI